VPDSGTANFHEPPVMTEGDDAEETRRPSHASATSTSAASARSKVVKDQIHWHSRTKTQENVVHSMFMRLLGAGEEIPALEKSEMNAVGVFMNSTPVNHICCIVIILNAMCIGASAHFALRAEIEQKSVSKTWEHFEVVFTSWFTAEILLRMLGERRLFYLGDNRGWNLMDLLLVVSSLATLVTTASTASWTAMRMLRIFRLIRIFRAVKVVRSIQNFRIMIIAIFQSCGTLMWVFVVILSFQFFFAVLFMHGAADYFKDEGLHSNDAEAIKDLFGDLFVALLTLFESITGGRDWHEVVVALVDIGWAYATLFLVYIFFMTFLVLNVVVGGVVKTTSEVYKRDRNLVVAEEQQAFHLYGDEVKRFFRDADKDGSGTLSWEEFCKYLNDDKVKAYFQSLDLEISQAHMLFTLLDTDEDDEVGIDEFIDGCLSLKGQARTIDVKYLTQQLKMGLEDMTRKVNDKFDKLAGADFPSRRNSRISVRRGSLSQPLAQRSECSPSP
jgi:Ca2+-binding EF-hand superfamily protein